MNTVPFLRRFNRSFILATVISALIAPPLSAQTTKKRTDRPNGLEKISKLLFGSSNRTAKRTAPAASRTPSRSIIYDVRGAARPVVVSHAVAPIYQNHVTVSPQPEVVMTKRGGRNQLSLPVTPGASYAPSMVAPSGLDDTLYFPSQALPAPMPPPVAVAEKVPLPPVPDFPDYSRPVPGRPGFVYPPGAANDAKYIIDVRNMTAGAKVRDPWTGNVFLVPPE